MLNDTNYSTRDIIIDELVLVSTVGNVDLSKVWNRINIYEDIFSSVVTGSIDIVDARNIYSSYELQGNEYITIVFYRPGENLSKYTKTFRVYSVSDRQPLEKAQGQMYTLHFCSEEQIFSNQQTLSKSYNNADINLAIVSILKENLKINLRKINLNNFEKSFGKYNGVLSNYTPLDLILKLTEKAFTENESTFLFFENREGFNFVSLETMFNRAPITKLNYDTARFTVDQTNSAAISNNINKFNIKTCFDVLTNTKSPLYSSKLQTLDILTQKYRTYEYSFGDLKQKNGSAARKLLLDKTGGFLVSNALNRNNKALYQEHDTYRSYHLTNLGQNDSQWVRGVTSRNSTRIVDGKPVPITISDTNVERTMMQRVAQLYMLLNTSIDCTVPANPFYTPGYVVEFDMPGFMPETEAQRNIDPFLSGKYLITAVRHVMTPSGGQQTIMTLSKNSVGERYTNYNNDKHAIARTL